ncbi:hypothetical protein [Zoogloea sp.]|uniref:hypothetical protein n=1 Tax=Zoogloea sp. TaxID=49181 RepID=UPI00321FCE45
MKTLKFTVPAVVLLAFLNSSVMACSARDDDWTGSDKAAHFGVSLAVGIGTSRLLDDTWTAFGLALVPGVAKELYDSTRDCNRFSWKDMAWNAAGAYVGVRAGNWLLGPTGVSYRAAF